MLNHIPSGIRFLFAIDGGLVVLAIAYFLTGVNSATLEMWVDLDREKSLPTWYASVQWFCAAPLFGSLAAALWNRRPKGLLALIGLSLACLACSADEIIGIHEWLGERSDHLLPGGDRANTLFHRTGIWVFVLGVPAVGILAAIVYSLRRLFLPARQAYRLLITGIVLMFGGATLMELTSNLIPAHEHNSAAALIQVSVEELLEMVGVTFIVWSGYSLLGAYGFRLMVAQRAYRDLEAIDDRSGVEQ